MVIQPFNLEGSLGEGKEERSLVIAPLIYRIQLPLHPLENGGLEVPAIELNGYIFATKKLLAAQIRNEALESLEDMVHTGVI